MGPSPNEHSKQSSTRKNQEPPNAANSISLVERLRQKTLALKTSLFPSTDKKDEKENSASHVIRTGVDPEDDEEEGDYRPGGYCPVKLGDPFFGGRYRILSKLGWGHFSTVWLAKDAKHQDAHVALKVVKSEARFREAALDEIDMLKTVAKHLDGKSFGHVVLLLKDFIHTGPTGEEHVCMVFEVMPGGSLLGFMKQFGYHGLPMRIVRSVARQVLIGLDLLHRKCAIIHTDLKPENVFLLKSPTAGDDFVPQVKIGDLGNACWAANPLTSDIQTRQYRSPEVILGCPYDTTTDLWSLGCMLWEMATGAFLFAPKGTSSTYSKDEEHIFLMMEALGPCPHHMIVGGKYAGEIFNRMGELRHIRHVKRVKLHDILIDKHQFGRKEAEDFVAFLLQLLEWNPKKRADARELLKHKWLGPQ